MQIFSRERWKRYSLTGFLNEAEIAILGKGTLGGHQALAEILSVARGIVEGDFSREIHDKLSGELGELAEHLNHTIKSLRMWNSDVAVLANEVPDVRGDLGAIRDETEEACIKIFDSLEEIMSWQEEIAKAAESGGEYKSIEKIAELSKKSTEKLIDVIADLAFSDLADQKVKKVSAVLDDATKKLECFMNSFGIKIETAKGEGYSPVAKRLAQGLVDDLINSLREHA